MALELDPEIARYEADEEVQDLLNASSGLNLGIDFLPGSFGYDGELHGDGAEAARVVWLDALCANVDRSWRNPNLLVWHGDLWVIDHGASLYFHHGWGGGIGDPERFAAQPWDPTDHVLLDRARRARRDRRGADRPDRRERARGGGRRGAGRLAGARPGRGVAGGPAGGVRRLPDRPAAHPRRGCPTGGWPDE